MGQRIHIRYGAVGGAGGAGGVAYAGGIAGQSSGVIQGTSYSTANITATGGTPGNAGTGGNGGATTATFNSVTAAAAGAGGAGGAGAIAYAGGIVGNNTNTISSSYATGDIVANATNGKNGANP